MPQVQRSRGRQNANEAKGGTAKPVAANARAKTLAGMAGFEETRQAKKEEPLQRNSVGAKFAGGEHSSVLQ